MAAHKSSCFCLVCVSSGTPSQRWTSRTDPFTPSRFATSWSQTRTTGWGPAGFSDKLHSGSEHYHSSWAVFLFPDLCLKSVFLWSCLKVGFVGVTFSQLWDNVSLPGGNSVCNIYLSQEENNKQIYFSASKEATSFDTFIKISLEKLRVEREANVFSYTLKCFLLWWQLHHKVPKTCWNQSFSFCICRNVHLTQKISVG